MGYLGDGINDAPALSAADVGVSVEEAVDVARESADVILLNNFLSSLPSMAISSDAVDAEQIQVAQTLQASDIQRYMLVFGLISSPFDLITFVLLLQVFHAPQSLFQTAWFVMFLLTELAVVMVLRTRGRAWRSQPGRWLVWTSLAVAVVAVAAPYLGPVSRLFDFTPMPPADGRHAGSGLRLCDSDGNRQGLVLQGRAASCSPGFTRALLVPGAQAINISGRPS